MLIVPLSVLSASPRVVTEDERVLSNTPTVRSIDPKIVVTNDGTLHVVWQEGVKGLDTDEPVIMHVYRSPGGSWSRPTEVYWDGSQPSIATDGNTVGVAFVRNPFDQFDSTEILYKIWDNETKQWPEEPQAIEGDIALQGSQPSLAFDRFHGYLWIVWLSSRAEPNRPYYARILVDSGQVESAGAIDDYEEGAQSPVTAVSPENDIHACWSTGYPSGESEINCWQWTEGSSYWTYNDPPLWDQIRQARAPDIDISTDLLCVTWHEGSQSRPNEIILSCDKPSGNVWFGNISWSQDDRSLLPSLEVDEKRGSMVLWRERRRSAPQQIVFEQGLPPPVPEPAPVNDGQATKVDMPSLAYASGYAHAVWVEETEQGGSEVRYARWEAALPTATPSATSTPSATATQRPTHTPTPSITPTGTIPTPSATSSELTPTPPAHSIYLARLDNF